MSHYKPYSAYKDSGVEWLGRVPEHWAVCKLSFRYSIELGKMLDEKKLTKTSLVPYLRNQDVQWGSINTQDLPEMDIHPEELERYTVRDGDLLVCEGGDVGRAAIWRGDSAVFGYQKALHRLRQRSSSADAAEFFYFSLLAAKQRGVLEASDSKATIAHLPAEKFRQYRFAFPPLIEQRAISAHLERETVRIDALVEKKTHFIELLREKRQALITHAVTKGLDPTVKMKDSGEEWLGDVPERWTVVRFRDLCSSISTGPFGTALGNEDYVTGGVPVINPSHIVDDQCCPDSDITVSEATADRLRFWAMQTGDLITARRGELGRAAVIGERQGGWICGTGSLRVRPTFGKVAVNYMHTVLQSRYAREWLNLFSVGATMANLNEGILGRLPVAVPPSVEEQVSLLALLEAQVIRLSRLEAKAIASIALLKERRSALITAAVTGQIDLREAV